MTTLPSIPLVPSEEPVLLQQPVFLFRGHDGEHFQLNPEKAEGEAFINLTLPQITSAVTFLYVM